MDLSAYCEELYEAYTNGAADPDQLIPLTDEQNQRFFDFDTHKVLQAVFCGQGPSFSYNDQVIHTWCFKDLDGKEWLTAKWQTLDEPYEHFQGFSKEIPGKFVYSIHYQNHVKTTAGDKAHCIVYRKLPD